MRYLRNKPLISDEEQKILGEKQIAIFGLGGLGGYLAHGALRLGIRRLHLVDGDCFSVSNLNRQLFCTEKNLGKPKVEVAKEGLLAIDPKAEIITHEIYLEDAKESQLFQGVDLLLDGFDNIPSRFVLQEISRLLQVPLVHGAIEGYNGQFAFIEPDRDPMKYIYRGSSSENSQGNLSFVASMIASYQLLLMLQYFLEDPALPKNQLVRLDLRHQERTVIML